MYDVILFAGTTEGRTIADYLADAPYRSVAFTATEYGGSELRAGISSDTGKNGTAGVSSAGADGMQTSGAADVQTGPDRRSGCLRVESRRMDEAEMVSFFRDSAKKDAIVIDATHPYAVLVTKNLKNACEKTGLRYIRVLRKDTMSPDAAALNPDIHLVNSPEQAADFLAGTQGNVLLTTGSKELSAFTRIPDYKSRLYARVLSLPKVVQQCADLGFQGRNLICMQGPFSEEMNIALIHQTSAAYLVTKDTGKEGGFPEKVSAAGKCGCELVVIRRPDQEEQGISPEECIEKLRALAGSRRV